MKKLNENGQIFSLDFLISLVVVIVCLAIVLQVFELTSYDAKQQQVAREVMVIGELASERLVTDERVLCQVSDGFNPLPGFELVNCLDTNRLTALNKGLIGIPASFSCNVAGVTLSGCTDGSPPNTAQNVFEIERRVILSSGPITKASLSACIDGAACALNDTNITVTVWR
jgi:hypothetical protein